MLVIPSEPLGLEQSVDQVDHEPQGDEGGERVVEDHGCLLRDGRRRWCRQPIGRRRRVRCQSSRHPALQAPVGESSHFFVRVCGELDVHQTSARGPTTERAISVSAGISFRGGTNANVIGILYIDAAQQNRAAKAAHPYAMAILRSSCPSRFFMAIAPSGAVCWIL